LLVISFVAILQCCGQQVITSQHYHGTQISCLAVDGSCRLRSHVLRQPRIRPCCSIELPRLLSYRRTNYPDLGSLVCRSLLQAQVHGRGRCTLCRYIDR
jgi:hypothetical protein